jgi:hypothetical protein
LESKGFIIFVERKGDAEELRLRQSGTRFARFLFPPLKRWAKSKRGLASLERFWRSMLSISPDFGF